MHTKVFCEELQIGMYVAELDRPWLDTPFAFQGFLIRNEKQIAALRQYCTYVLVDPLRSNGWDRLSNMPQRKRALQRLAFLNRQKQRIPKYLAPLPLTLLEQENRGAFAQTRKRYAEHLPLEEEMPRAKTVHMEAEAAVQQLFSDLRQQGTANLEMAHEVIDEMVESIIRNPDALGLLSQIKDASSYVYGRAVSVAINMLMFGRHLGFPRDHMHMLGAAGLLLDVGSIHLPPSLLTKRGQLEENEYETIQYHVRYGLDMLRSAKGINEKILTIVAQHHEREDGSGYPKGIKGQAIGIPGKMAAIADCYDALTSKRPYARAFSPYEALQHLYDWRNHLFHAELVEQFIQCLSIYPVGSLVELNSGEVAVVLAHNRVRRLKPKVLVILDSNKQPHTAPITLDMLTTPNKIDGEDYEIVRALEQGMYGIDPRDYYL